MAKEKKFSIGQNVVVLQSVATKYKVIYHVITVVPVFEKISFSKGLHLFLTNLKLEPQIVTYKYRCISPTWGMKDFLQEELAGE